MSFFKDRLKTDLVAGQSFFLTTASRPNTVAGVKIFVIIFLLISSTVHAGSADDDGTPKNLYITGGIVGSVVGFGIGHIVEHRYWRSHAWIFSATEALAVTFVTTNGFTSCSGKSYPYKDDCDQQAASYRVLGVLLFSGFHVWEVLDLWLGTHINNSAAVGLNPTILDSKTPGLALVRHF